MKHSEATIRLCPKCGGPVHPGFETGSGVCEDCFTFGGGCYGKRQLGIERAPKQTREKWSHGTNESEAA